MNPYKVPLVLLCACDAQFCGRQADNLPRNSCALGPLQDDRIARLLVSAGYCLGQVHCVGSDVNEAALGVEIVVFPSSLPRAHLWQEYQYAPVVGIAEAGIEFPMTNYQGSDRALG